jgi:hypothetical protein
MAEIFLGRGQKDIYFKLSAIKNHGIICGASGSGKVASAKLLIEGLFQNNVRIFGFDVSGEVSNVSQPARINRKIVERAVSVGINNYEPGFIPVHFWHGVGHGGSNIEWGNKLRIAPLSLGPSLLANLLNLKSTQAVELSQAFAKADAEGIVCDSLLDLPLPKGAIREKLEKFIDKASADLFQVKGVGLDDALSAPNLYQHQCQIALLMNLAVVPRLYASLAVWALATILEHPTNTPTAVFFDEAQLIFEKDTLTSEWLDLLKLASQKGIGVFFISNTLADIPAVLRDHIELRIHHHIRGRSKNDIAGIEVGRIEMPLSKLDFQKAVTELHKEEALILIKGESLSENLAEWILVAPIQSRDEQILEDELKLISPKSLEHAGLSNPYSDEDFIRSRIKKAATLSLNQDDGEEQSVPLKAVKRGILGVRVERP